MAGRKRKRDPGRTRKRSRLRPRNRPPRKRKPRTRRSAIDTDRKIKVICESAYDKKAEDIIVMDMGQRPTLSRIFVVMSAPSTVRVKAIVDSIDDGIKDADGMRPIHKEGYEAGTWVLLDYGDVVAHVFHEETRKFYDLENLWGDVPKKNYNPPASKRKANDAA